MSEQFIKFGPVDGPTLPRQSLGIIVHDLLKNRNENKTTIVNSKTGVELSCKEVAKAASQVAINLRKLGLKKGDVVTIVSENNSDFVITTISALYLGAKLNLLNPDYTTNELRHFFTICKPQFVFCSTKVSETVLELKKEFSSVQIIDFDNKISAKEGKHFSELLQNVDDSEIEKFRPVELDPNEEVALILSSSGTTGFPKGVLLTHTNVRANMEAIGNPKLFDANEDEIILNYLPFFHVLGFALYFGSIVFGCKLIVMDKFIPDKFLGLIQEHKVKTIYTVPPILMFLGAHPIVAKFDLSSIKNVVCTGAPVGKQIETIVQKRLNLSCIRQFYGLTELAGAGAVVPKDQSGKNGSIGKVTANHKMKVCDVETKKPVGPNVVGELCIKGEAVMKGYCANIEETKASFDDEGYLKTGDLGYYDEDEFFFIVDRLKEVIKYKGFQVAPAELESILLKHPAVKGAGVVGLRDERAGELPLAFVVKQPNNDVNEEEIIRFVADNVSIQKQLHGGVRFVNEIPVSASGKILRRKLKELL